MLYGRGGAVLLLLFKRLLGRAETSSPAAGTIESPESAVQRIRDGDEELRGLFIAAYRPYIAKVTSRFCKRYIDPERDDEFSIALLAFNEAIDQYAPGAGRSFLGFAETVIRRRLIDHVRREKRHALSAPMSAFDTEDEEEQGSVNPVEIRLAVERHDRQRDAEERKLEIEEFSVRLAEYGITFAELAEVSPKHADSRRMLAGIGRQIARSPDLLALLQSKKQLPIKQLLAATGVSRKTLERNRKFLIAIALLYDGSYPYLQNYLTIPETGPTHEGGEGI